VEVYGQWADSATLADCITFSSMATEMGAIIALMPPGPKVLDYFGMSREDAIYADPDATYEAEYTLDLGDLEPMLAAPPGPSNVMQVSSVPETPVDGVFIGSCTNGTYQDMEYAAGLLRGRKVAPGVMLKVVPATRKTWSRMLSEGLLADIFDAGGIISNCGCGGCASGQIGMTGGGEVQVSTSNRNFTGKQGSGSTYLAGIGTAVASAVLGKIATVRDLTEGSGS
jgi:3-isopropylmalate/(R)-2-methylmalate dehydratase large subunit